MVYITTKEKTAVAAALNTLTNQNYLRVSKKLAERSSEVAAEVAEKWRSYKSAA